MTVEGQQLAVGFVSFILGWLLSRAPARLRRMREVGAAYLEGYEKGQQQATAFFAGRQRPEVKQIGDAAAMARAGGCPTDDSGEFTRNDTGELVWSRRR